MNDIKHTQHILTQLYARLTYLNDELSLCNTNMELCETDACYEQLAMLRDQLITDIATVGADISKYKQLLSHLTGK